MNSSNTKEPQGDVWYFAYGSNLSKRRMLQRTGAIPISRQVFLRDYRLAFNAHVGQEFYANIMPLIGGMVHGVVYSCDEQAMTALDRYEGVAQGCYRRVGVEVETEGGERIRAAAYIAGERYVSEGGVPSAFYLGLIISGAREHDLPEQYVHWIESYGVPDDP
jgi:gamma-glutamylcyclotransferase